MIALMYRSFGLEPPAGAGGPALWTGAFLFVIVSAAMLLVLNFFSLFFGVTMNFLGRNGMKFRFLHLFGRVPVIGVSLPVLFGFAVWHNAETSGVLGMVYPSLVTVVVAVAMIAGFVLVNTLTARRP